MFFEIIAQQPGWFSSSAMTPDWAAELFGEALARFETEAEFQIMLRFAAFLSERSKRRPGDLCPQDRWKVDDSLLFVAKWNEACRTRLPDRFREFATLLWHLVHDAWPGRPDFVTGFVAAANGALCDEDAIARAVGQPGVDEDDGRFTLRRIGKLVREQATDTDERIRAQWEALLDRFRRFGESKPETAASKRARDWVESQ